MYSQVTSITEYNSIAVFSLWIVTYGTGRVFGGHSVVGFRDILGLLQVFTYDTTSDNGKAYQVKVFLLQTIHDDFEGLICNWVQLVLLTFDVDCVQPLLICSGRQPAAVRVRRVNHLVRPCHILLESPGPSPKALVPCQRQTEEHVMFVPTYVTNVMIWLLKLGEIVV